MAHRIDRAVLWLFAALSAFLLALIWTDGHITFSVISAFALIFLLRQFVSKIPERRRIHRRERLLYIRQLLHKWAIISEADALLEIRNRLPSLLADDHWSHVRLIQRLPDGDPLTANLLLGLWRSDSSEEALILISTGPADEKAVALAAELSQPSVRLIDAHALTRYLIQTVRTIPVTEIKTKRRAPSFARVAQWVCHIRPARTSLYFILFLLLYGSTGSILYLIASSILAGLLFLHALAAKRL